MPPQLFDVVQKVGVGSARVPTDDTEATGTHLACRRDVPARERAVVLFLAAVNQHCRLIDFRLTSRRTASAARAFLRQARESVRLCQSLTIATDKAHSYAKVIDEWNARLGPHDAIRHITRKHANNRIKGDHALLKRPLRPPRGLQRLWTDKTALKGVETFRAIRRADFEACETRVRNEIRFMHGLFSEGKATA